MYKLLKKIIDLTSRINIFGIREPIVVLNYHSINVASADAKEYEWTVQKNQFERQMQYLFDNNINVILLNDLVNKILQKKIISKPTVCITFDDGFSDNFINAAPVLEKYNYRASFFIVANSLLDEDSYPEWINQNKVGELPSFMNVDQIKKLCVNGHEIGSHSLTHKDLSVAKVSLLTKELFESKKIIEKSLSIDCFGFVMPFGISENHDKKNIVNNACAKNRYIYSCLGKYGYVDQTRFDAYNIPRIPIYGSDNINSFILKVNGKYNFASIFYQFWKKIRYFLKI